MPADTNATGFAYVAESALGTAGTSGWRQIEVNNPTEIGATISKTPRDPISTDRNRRKGGITSLRSTFAFEADATLSHLNDFLPYFLFVVDTGVGTKAVSSYAVTAVVDGGASPDEFTVAANGDLAAGELVYARGMGESGNVGIWEVVATSSATAIKVATGSLTAEASCPANATVEVCGLRAPTGVLEINASGNLISNDVTASGIDFTDYNLTVGQYIKIGGSATANQFATSANNGYARISAIAAATLTLDRTVNASGTIATFAADAGASKDIDLYYGPFLRNVAITDGDFTNTSLTFEVAYNFSTAEYDYPNGNYANEIAISLPLEDKATFTASFVGVDTPVPTTSRKTGASSALAPTRTAMLNTMSDLPFIHVLNSSGVDLAARFKSATVTLKNNCTPETVLGTLAAVAVPYGNFEVDLAGEMLFENTDFSTAVRNNSTVGFHMALRNDDGGCVIDVGEAVVDDGKLSFPRNETIKQSIPLMVHKDATLGYSLGVSLFPIIPV